MKLLIKTKEKKAIFISIFQQLRLFTKTLCIFFHSDHIYIQGMDASHVCLYESKLVAEWFEEYVKNDSDYGMICINPNILSSVLSMSEDDYSIEFQYEGEPESLDINICKISKVSKMDKTEKEKGWEYDKQFTVPLIEYECELMTIPDSDYDTQFCLPAKKIHELTSQLCIFGDELKIHVSEEEISLGTSGDSGEMKVNIHIDDILEFTINEGEVYDLSFSLQYVHTYCLTPKLTKEVQFSLTKDYPLRIKYSWDNNYIMFFIAPKLDSD